MNNTYYQYDVKRIKDCKLPHGYIGSFSAENDIIAVRNLIGTMGENARQAIIDGCFNIFLYTYEDNKYRHVKVSDYIQLGYLHKDDYPSVEQMNNMTFNELRKFIYKNNLLHYKKGLKLRHEAENLINDNRI